MRASDGTLTPVSTMRRVIAERLTQTAQTVPMVSTVFEVDLSAVLNHRDAHKAAFAERGARLTLTAYFALASVAALQAVPALNSEWRLDGIFTHRAAHLGIAVALEAGLIVPVIRHAESLNLLGMARAVNDAADRARGGQLAPDDTQGSTFTITNHGTGGSLFAQPILNAPNAGILGVGMMEKRVKVITDAQGRDSLAVRPCVYLSLTFDHRLADGAEGDAFLACVKDTLEGWN
jgi:2-oxoglutarate dehydrogenase E2 component (dihydrolipoamide succinyltransferase)